MLKSLQKDTVVTQTESKLPYLFYLPINLRYFLIVIFAYLGVLVPLLKGVVSLDSGLWGSQLLYLITLIAYHSLLLVPLFKFQEKRFNVFHPLLFFVLLELSFDLLKNANALFDAFNFFVLLKPDSNFFNPFSRPVAHYETNVLLLAAAKEYTMRILGLLAIYLGFNFAPNWRLPLLKFPTLKPRTINAAMLTIFSIFAGLLLYYIFVYKGGIEKSILSWQFGRSRLINDKLNFLKPMLILPAFVLVLWYLLLPTIMRNPLFWIVLIACSFGSYFVNGSRTIFFVPYILLVVLYTLQNQQINYRLIGILVVFVFLGIGVLGVFRTSTFEGKVNWQVFSFQSFSGLFQQSQSGLLRRYQVGSYTLPCFVKVPNEVNYLYGKTYVGVISFLVPRVIWQEKPRGVGIYNKELLFGGSGGGYPMHSAAEAYWNFGILGVFILHLLFGMFLNVLFRYYQKHQTESLLVVLYILSIFTLKPTSLAIVKYIQIILPIFLLLWMVGLLKILKR